MDREKLQSAAADYSHLRGQLGGLFGVPLGLLCILAAMGNWQVGPLRHNWVFVAGLVAIGLACVAIKRFYDDHYGRVTLTSRQRQRLTVAMAIAVPLAFGLSFLLRSNASWSLDLPVNPAAISFAIVIGLAYAATVGLRAHHVVVCGALLLAGLIPLWSGGDPSNVGLVLTGAAVIVSGVLDHRLLVHTLGPAKGLNLADGDVGA